MILHEKKAFGPTKLMIHMGNVGLRLLLKLISPLKGGWPLAERSAGVLP